MDLLFEKSREGRGCDILPECDVPVVSVNESEKRAIPLSLPQMSENDLSRHYTQLMKRTHGVNDGFYPLGSCTMKYNPKINEELAALPGFTGIHPLQPAATVQGCLEILKTTERYLCEITGMDAMTFQPAAGAHGEFTGLLLIKAYFKSRGDGKRRKIIVPDSAHGTNPASASMAGFEVVTVPSQEDGCVDIKALREIADESTAGLMLTNPNTVGIFDKNILEITKIIHHAGGLCYYDGANLNAVMGVVKPGDMGFDVMHVNLHKTFSAPHGGGGPGSGPVGCKKFLLKFLPGPTVAQGEKLDFSYSEDSIGRVRSFYGNFLVVVRAFAYLCSLGREGVPATSRHAVLNANYMMKKLSDHYDMAYPGHCMHEFVMCLEALKKENGISAMDIAKGLMDRGIHPPTMYFPLIVNEALMVEPTETESKETLDEAIQAFEDLYRDSRKNPEKLHEAPTQTPIRRPDEVKAARKPILKYQG